MKTLREVINDASNKGVAIGHFNISNIEGLWAIFRAAQKVGVPVIIGLSEGESKFVGVRQAVALVKSIREQYDYPIYLNADHTHSFEGVKEVIDAGYDAALFDGVDLSYEENIEITKKCVEYAREQDRDVLIEAEMGYIGASSKMLDKVPEGIENSYTKPEDAKAFVDATGIDLFSPAVGNIHGMLKGIKNPSLDIDRIKAIKEAIGIPMVLHGGSGIADDNFREAIAAGISAIHINTEIRLAYREAIKKAIADDPEQVAPYKIMKGAVEDMQKVVEGRLKLFSGIS